MTALVRYLFVDLIRSQRWVAPFVLFLVVVVTLGAGGDPSVGSFGLAAAAMFPLAAWLTWATTGCEDLLQEMVTATSAGGLWQVRLGKMLTGAMAAGLLSLVVVLIVLGKMGPDVGAIVTVVVALALNVVAGAAVGFVFAPPVVTSRGLAVLGITLVSLAELLVPWCPPGRATLQTLYDSHDVVVRLLMTTTVTATLTALAVAAGLVLTLRKA